MRTTANSAIAKGTSSLCPVSVQFRQKAERTRKNDQCKGMFSYDVSFESNGVKLDYTEDFNDREANQSLIVRSVRYAGIGFATDLE